MEAVREAEPADGDRYGELEAELVASVAAQRGGALLVHPDRTGRPGSAVPLADLLGAVDVLVLMGTLDDVATGYLRAHVEELGPHGRRGVLDACYVEPEARGVGLGRLLLDRAMAWFAERGCTGVDGTALPGDRSAKSFFEAAGFKARLLTMHTTLE
jgi:GNAT superfamily N-acetyltransferase